MRTRFSATTRRDDSAPPLRSVQQQVLGDMASEAALYSVKGALRDDRVTSGPQNNCDTTSARRPGSDHGPVRGHNR